MYHPLNSMGSTWWPSRARAGSRATTRGGLVMARGLLLTHWGLCQKERGPWAQPSMMGPVVCAP